MSRAASEFEISDTALKKKCLKAQVPVPPRGYWAKKDAGKRVSQIELPPRPPGLSDTIEFGQPMPYRLVKEDYLGPPPSPPIFDETIEEVSARVSSVIGRVICPRRPKRWHPTVTKVIAVEECFRKRGYLRRSELDQYEIDPEYLETPAERRRARILNSLFFAVSKLGAKPQTGGESGSDLFIDVNGRNVTLELVSLQHLYDTRKIKTKPRPDIKPTDLKLSIGSLYSKSDGKSEWEDRTSTRLEDHLSEIATEIIVTAERHYREAAFSGYEWRLETRARLLEEEHKARLEAERAEQARLAQIEQAKIDRLLGDAEALRQANSIRVYVGEIEDLLRVSPDKRPSKEQVERWKHWALTQANRIDPVLNGKFLATMSDGEEPIDGTCT